MMMTTDEINAEVNPAPADLVKETEQLFRHGEWKQASANIRRLMKRVGEGGGYTEAQCYHALGDCAMNLGMPSQAITYYRDTLHLDPTNLHAQENLIFLLDAQPWTSDRQAQRARDDWWEHIGKPAYAKRKPHLNVRDPEKRLRVGYVSSDFRFHSAVIAFSNVVNHHTDQIEPVFYSTLPEPQWDANTKREWQDRYGPAFQDVSRYTPEAFAEIVQNDLIDILVDLSGYTAGNRLHSFAHKPAPVQITAWGYATGAGWPAMDYLFADPVVATPAMRKRLPETVVDLPCVISFYPRPDLPEPNPLPCLSGWGPVFGVFQRAMKLNEETLRTWMKILQRVPESTILFKGPDYTPDMREWIVKIMNPVRRYISFQFGGSHFDHQHWYQTVDLSLDPWPQTGGVSTMEACNMGVPCVTLIGERVIQRTSASILTVLGLPQFVTQTKQDYIARAVEMVTTRRDELNEIRLGLRTRLHTSPIIAGYRDAVETAYRMVWRTWCASHSVEGTT